MNNTIEIMPGIFWTGIVDHDLKKFDVIMETEYGTNYNSYIVKGTEKIALIDTAKESFRDDYIEKLKSIVDISKIDYIVVNHTEPDHSGCLKSVLELAPNALVICTAPAKMNLTSILNGPFNCMIPKADTVIDLGGKTLKFISAPFLHWPDTMFTYVAENKALFTCDAFGCHFATDTVLESKEDGEFLKAQKYYYEVIMSPFAKYVIDAIEKLNKENVAIDIILPSHGPVLDQNPHETIKRYHDWAMETLGRKKTNRAAVAYVSCYGYTKLLAEQIAEGLKAEGMETKLMDVSEMSVEGAADILTASSVFAVGSPTVNKDVLKPVWDVLLSLSSLAMKDTKVVAFGSYGWSGEAVPFMEQRLKELGCDVISSLKVKFRPIEGDLKQAYELGKTLAQTQK